MKKHYITLTPNQAEALEKAMYFTLVTCFDINNKKYRSHAMRILRITPEQVDELMKLHAELYVEIDLTTIKNTLQ